MTGAAASRCETDKENPSLQTRDSATNHNVPFRIRWARVRSWLNTDDDSIIKGLGVENLHIHIIVRIEAVKYKLMVVLDSKGPFYGLASKVVSRAFL